MMSFLSLICILVVATVNSGGANGLVVETTQCVMGNCVDDDDGGRLKLVLNEETNVLYEVDEKQQILLSENETELEIKSDLKISSQPASGDNFDYLDNTLHASLRDCWHQTHRRVKLINVVTAMNTRFTFKRMVLRDDEFNVTEEGILRVSFAKSNFTGEYYGRVGDRLHLCCPMSPSYVDCSKFYFSESAIRLDANQRRLQVEPYSYDVDEFYVDQYGSAVVCSPLTVRVYETVLIVGFAISALSILLTLVLSLTVSELHLRDKKVFLCHIVMLCAFYFVQFFSRFVLPVSSTQLCLLVCFVHQYCDLSAFFWVTVQAIDFSSVCSNVCRAQLAVDRRKRDRRFVQYCLYGWGVPAVICVVTLVTEFTVSTDSIFYPGFQEFCWFDDSNKLLKLLFLYGPIGINLVINVLLFVVILYKLCKMGRQISIVNKHIKKQLFQVYLRLVVVLGLCWMLTIAAWAVDLGDSVSFGFGVVSSLQGFFILVIYIGKQQSIRVLKRKITSSDLATTHASAHIHSSSSPMESVLTHSEDPRL